MHKEISILSSVIIQNRKVFLNDELFLESIPENDFLKSFYNALSLNYPKFNKMDIMSKLGFLSTHLLMTHARELILNIPAEDISLMIQTNNGSLDVDYAFHESLQDVPRPALFVYTLPNIALGEISISQQFKGEQTLFVSEHFDSEQLIEYVSLLLQNNRNKYCVCGWLDASNNIFESYLFLVAKGNNADLNFTSENIQKLIKNGE